MICLRISFFEHAVKVIETSRDRSAARAYIYGVICHFALDSECHKYVEKMIQVSGISHGEIEMELDQVSADRRSYRSDNLFGNPAYSSDKGKCRSDRTVL